MFRQKIRRLLELFQLVSRAADGPSRRLIRSCYFDLGACLGNAEAMTLRMKAKAGPLACHLRRSDIFTLAEIFAEGVYAAALPLEPGAVVIDAGANIGLASVWFHGACPDARILAFEPDAENAAWARRNLFPIATAEVHELALDEKSGRARLHRGAHDAVHSLVDDSANSGFVEVETARLDDFLAEREIEKVDVLKLDVEGAELRVLAGMGEQLKNCRLVIGELHEDFVSADDLRDALARGGLKLELFALEEQGVRGFLARRVQA